MREMYVGRSYIMDEDRLNGKLMGGYVKDSEEQLYIATQSDVDMFCVIKTVASEAECHSSSTAREISEG